MVIEPVLLVELLAREAVALTSKAAEASPAVRGVLLAVDPGASLVEHEAAAAEVIAEVKLDVRRLVVGVADPSDSDPTLVVHDVEPVVLFRGTLLGPASVLEEPVNVDRDVDGSTLLADELRHALAARVV